MAIQGLGGYQVHPNPYAFTGGITTEGHGVFRYVVPLELMELEVMDIIRIRGYKDAIVSLNIMAENQPYTLWITDISDPHTIGLAFMDIRAKREKEPYVLQHEPASWAMVDSAVVLGNSAYPAWLRLADKCLEPAEGLFRSLSISGRSLRILYRNQPWFPGVLTDLAKNLSKPV
jgi:hypothetical protein